MRHLPAARTTIVKIMARIFVAGSDLPRDRNDAEKSLAHPVERQLVIRSFSDSTYPELIEIERHGHGFYAWGLPLARWLHRELVSHGQGRLRADRSQGRLSLLRPGARPVPERARRPRHLGR